MYKRNGRRQKESRKICFLNNSAQNSFQGDFLSVGFDIRWNVKNNNHDER